jgi:hypothetical protein
MHAFRRRGSKSLATSFVNFSANKARLIISFFWAVFLGVLCLLPSVGKAEYCLAVRGNGELAPSHWGGFARAVEQLGWPQAMAGGSSAAINIFLFESIKINPALGDLQGNEKIEASSYLIKSLQSYLETFALHPGWRQIKELSHDLLSQSHISGMDFVPWAKAMLAQDPKSLVNLLMKNQAAIENSVQFAIEMGLLNEEIFDPLSIAMNEARTNSSDPIKAALAMTKLKFLAGEALDAMMLLGAFNAETDANLFFRSGIVNFRRIARTFGKVANFYAARGMSTAEQQDLKYHLATCAKSTRGLTWDLIRKKRPFCDEEFKSLIAKYESSSVARTFQSREFDKVGDSIASFPTTSILRLSSADKALSALNSYMTSMNPAFGSLFTSFTSNDKSKEEVRFGYWGQLRDLNEIEKNLKSSAGFTTSSGRHWNFSQDEKSQRFLNLGEARWEEVLRTSPAEQGLAPFQTLNLSGEILISAGGWSDLHPGAILRAHGCEQTIYLTRRGGESLFAQGVAKRLLGLNELPWRQISTSESFKQQSEITNNNGISLKLKVPATSERSVWNRLFNLANPMSSINTSLQTFDAVICSSWNKFDIKESGAISAMIEDSYNAPWALTEKSSLATDPFKYELKKRGIPVVESQQNVPDPSLGFRPYSGCLYF